MSRRAVLAVVAAFSILSAGVGWVLGQQIKSPAEIAAETAAPAPSLITAPLERQELSSQVVVRGVLESTEATPIRVQGSAVGVPVVTAMTVEVGDELAEGDVAVEISGRPLILLQGVLPLYRPIGPGMEGPDVAQLQESLVRMGFDPGPVDGRYETKTAEAVGELYESLGYEPASLIEDPAAAVSKAQGGVRSASDLLANLESGQVGDLADQLEDVDPEDFDFQDLISQFQGGGQPTPEQARQQLEAARQNLAEVTENAGPSISRYEVVFVPTLPRVVQSVSVRVGSSAEGDLMTVTGSESTINSVLSEVDRQLVREGLEAVVEDENLGIRAAAQVFFVADNPGGESVPNDRYVMRLKPLEPLPEEAMNKSLRITISVSSTGGEVLTVPISAVSTSPNRQARVEVETSDGRTRLVPVETGLAANGFVEVVAIDGDLNENDRVVVGQDLMRLRSEADLASSSEQ